MNHSKQRPPCKTDSGGWVMCKLTGPITSLMQMITRLHFDSEWHNSRKTDPRNLSDLANTSNVRDELSCGCHGNLQIM